jgi:ornithine cyclodeaminase
VIAGTQAGRPSAKAITVADLTGTGVQDTAIAALARQRAIAAGAGTDFDS